MHIGPEQAIVASQMMKANLVLPVHWATFDLSLHGWTEPIKRVCRADGLAGVAVTTPRPGESADLSVAIPRSRWWPDLPHRTGVEEPVAATGSSEDLNARIREPATP